MGPSAAVNAVFYNQLQAIEDAEAREARRRELMDEEAAKHSTLRWFWWPQANRAKS